MTNATTVRGARKATRPRATPATAEPAVPARRAARVPAAAAPPDAQPEPAAVEGNVLPSVPVEILGRVITVQIPSPDQLIAYRRIGKRLTEMTATDVATQMEMIDDALDLFGGLMSAADMHWLEKQVAAKHLTLEEMINRLFAGITAGAQAHATAKAPTTGPRPRARRR